MPKLISDNPDFFEVQRDDGQAFKVAKSGLSDPRLDYFSKLEPLNPTPEIPAAPPEPVYADGVTPIAPDPQREVANQEIIDTSNFNIPENQSVPTEREASPLDKYSSAVRETANMESQGAVDRSKEMDALNQQQAQIAQQFDQREQDLKLKEAEAEKQYKEVSEEYFNSKEVDQDRYWSNLSTGRKITAGIGLALASLNPQALQVALGSINRAVDRDIQAQKLEIGKKRDRVNESKSLVGKFYQKYKDLDAAEAAAKMTAIEKTKLKLQSIQETTKSSTVRTKAETAIAQMEVEMLKNQSKLKERLVNIGGYTGVLSNPTEAKGFREAMNNLSTAETSINRLLEINDKTGKSLSTDLRAEAEVLQKSLIGLLRVPLTGPGAMNASEQALLERLVANPTDVFALDSSNKVKLKTLLKTLKSKAANEAKNLGLQSSEDKLGFKPQ